MTAPTICEDLPGQLDMLAPTIGSLCTGYGGLDLAAELALGVALGVPLTHAWYAEVDKAAQTVLSTRLPGVANLGDITRIDWTRVPRVDILTAGWPCQPWSLAGKRKGKADARAIWPAVADAVRDLRPRLVYLENVAAIAPAGELARAAADLAAIGYVGSWRCVRASDVGAPHQRARIFIAAWPADAHPSGWRENLPGLRTGQPDAGWSDAAHPAGIRHGNARPSGVGGIPAAAVGGSATAVLLKTPTAQLAVNGGSQHPDKRKAGGHGPTLADEIEHLLPTPAAARSGRQRSASPGAAIRPSLDMVGALLPTPMAANSHGNDVNNRGNLLLPGAVRLLPTATAMDSRGAHNATSGRKAGSEHHDGWTLSDVAYADRWGEYGPAIARWEAVLGRPAPEPTEPGKTGPRLAARFVEFLMGLPAGHVTDLVGRNDALRLLGNGVVPQQGAYALGLMLATAALGVADAQPQ